ncbi:hypothetical protein [Pukyongiella litopenaei]|uniref:Uncharacterized protein n=1 Tax=Pukyongiella litopenaei TaxID=2605946 RepID=A0A2S0MUI1_9RHOB|nr:hypothetical protein [Pukyongiella litopenaei]AVO39549.1 hypothetical protein C6Y53_18855 [Pukyongiella litopenaei]
MRKRFVLTAMLAGLVPLSALAFSAPHGARVNPVSNAVFEVVPRSSGNGPVFWCAAADYARRALGAPWTARIYIARGRGVSETTGRRSSVQFTLDPAAAGIQPMPPSVSLNALRAGDNMSVQEANSYCHIPPRRF